MCFKPCTAFQQKIVKIGPSSNEGLKYRDIEIVTFEYGKCCAHFFRGSMYILEPVAITCTLIKVSVRNLVSKAQSIFLLMKP